MSQCCENDDYDHVHLSTADVFMSNILHNEHHIRVRVRVRVKGRLVFFDFDEKRVPILVNLG